MAIVCPVVVRFGAIGADDRAVPSRSPLVPSQPLRPLLPVQSGYPIQVSSSNLHSVARLFASPPRAFGRRTHCPAGNPYNQTVARIFMLKIFKIESDDETNPG